MFGFDGMYDIYYGIVLLLYCKLILLMKSDDWIGELYLCCLVDKIVVIVEIDVFDCSNVFIVLDVMFK